MNDLLRAVEDIRRRTVPDRRLGVFDITLDEQHGLAGDDDPVKILDSSGDIDWVPRNRVKFLD